MGLLMGTGGVGGGGRVEVAAAAEEDQYPPFKLKQRTAAGL